MRIRTAKKINITRSDVVWNYVGTALSLGANIIILPFVLICLSGDELGLWYVFQSLGGIAVLFDFGFNATFARNVAYCWSGAKWIGKTEVDQACTGSDPNFVLMKSVLHVCKLVYLVVSLLTLFLLGSIGTCYIVHISKSIPQSTYLLAWVLYLMAIFLNMYYGYYASFLRGVGAVGKVSQAIVASRILQVVLSVALLMLGLGLVGAAAAYLCYGCVFRLLGRHFFYRHEDIEAHLSAAESKPVPGETKRLFKVMWHNAWKDGLVNLANYLSNQASTILASVFLGLGATGVYSLGAQVAMAVASISAATYGAYQPALQNAYVVGDTRRMKDVQALIVGAFIGVYLVASVSVVFFGMPLLGIIKPENELSVPIMIGLLLFQFALKFRDCYTSYFSSTNRIIYVRAFVLSAIASVLLSLVLLGMLDMGVAGLIVGQLVSQLCFNAWYWAKKANQELGMTVFGALRYSVSVLAKLLDRKRKKHDRAQF